MDEFEAVFVPSTYTFVDAPGCCRYNHGVGCTEKTECYHCGWNPVIAAKRMEKIRRKLK